MNGESMCDSSAVTRLVASVRPGAAVTAVTPLSGGRNNRVYRVDTTAGAFAAKEYFAGGEWDRLAAETRFLAFCEKNAVVRVPRFLAADAEAGLALHSWLAGENIQPRQAEADNSVAAARFLADLRRAGRGADFSGVPPARDAALGVADFWRSPRERLRELAAALENAQTAIERDAERFLRQSLQPRWEEIERAGRQAAADNPAMAGAFPPRLLFYSPSDFGLHNALRSPNGEINFIDFEYAGRDSVVKAIADFVCQPTVPPAAGALEELTAAVAETPEERGELARILSLVLPAVRLKFCCIILNDFKGLDRARRGFALAGDEAERLAEQLNKAQSYFTSFLHRDDG